MAKFDKVKIVKNVGSSWFALGVNILVGVFVSPYILHHLGDDAFGLWVLIFAITGYYGLFDLGIRSSIIRFVAKYSASGEKQELDRLISTALIAYSAIGVVAFLVTLIGTYFVDSIFHIGPAFLQTARWLFFLVGSAVALGFPIGIAGGILEGLQRFYVLNFTNIGTTLIRALGIVFVLRYGHGLLAVAAITVSMPLIAGVINAITVMRILPIRLSITNLSRASMRSIATYSSSTLMILVSSRLRFKTDAMIIGTFLSAAAITYFTIGSRLVDYAGDVVGGLAQVFVPMSSESDATGDLTGLRKIFLAGNRACALVIFPMAAILIVLGKSVIEVWVGARYVAQSYPIMLVLLIPSTFMWAQSASNRVLFGMAKHKTLAIVTLLEGSANVLLSIILVRRFGIMGDAVGTAIPLLCTTLFFLPRHLCRILKLKIRAYIREAFLLPLGLCVPLVIALLLLRKYFLAHSYLELALQLTIALTVYGLGLFWAAWTRKAWQVELLDAEAANQAAIGVIETYEQEEA